LTITDERSPPRHRATAPGRAVIDVRNLVTEIVLPEGISRAVDDVSLKVHNGKTLCIVGESGSGKSVTALSIMQLISSPPMRKGGGQVLFDGRDLLALNQSQMSEVRGNDISMIFQEPMTSLNPVLTIGYQIAEVIRRHQKLKLGQARARAIEMLELVRIPEPVRRASEYPHQLSGGMRQRAMIAMALSCHPKLLIADEPTTALDVTIQAQVLELIEDLQTRLGTAVIFITHDLGVVAEIADAVIVMYAGQKVEEAPVDALFARPHHPYTVGLLGSMPKLGSNAGTPKRLRPRLTEIPGIVPSLIALPPGCSYAPRCPLADEICRRERPPLKAIDAAHSTACWHSEKL
jgi:peptide/nickel transport system ATP-binding protein